jgi:hypothetical protein
MKVDDTYLFLRNKANLSAYRYSTGESSIANVDFWAGKIIDQVRKHNETHCLPILNLPDA